MSMETALARAEVTYQADLWKAHKMFCPRCARGAAARRHDRGGLCSIGERVWTDLREAKRLAGISAELDKMPAPDQEAMF